MIGMNQHDIAINRVVSIVQTKLLKPKFLVRDSVEPEFVVELVVELVELFELLVLFKY